MTTICLSHRQRSSSISPMKFIFFKLAGAKGGSREIVLRMTKFMNDAKYRGCLEIGVNVCGIQLVRGLLL